MSSTSSVRDRRQFPASLLTSACSSKRGSEGLTGKLPIMNCDGSRCDELDCRLGAGGGEGSE